MAGVVDELSLATRLAGFESGGINYSPFFKRVKVMLAASAKRNFAGGKAPDGTAWLPLKRARTRNKRGKGAGSKIGLPLRDTGKLMASMTARGAEHYETETSMRLEWGSNVSYASYHQAGTKHIPARPFLGWNDELADEVTEALQDFVADKIAKW